MPNDLKQSYQRIMAARLRLVENRNARVAGLLRLQAYLRKRLADFFTNLDPITGARLAELGLEGSKAHGDIALTLAFFEGSRFKITIDQFGGLRLLSEPNVFEDVGTLVGLHVAEDLSAADIEFLAPGEGATHVRSAGLSTYLDALIEHAVQNVEREAGPALTGL
jgi:hypothetical protein